MGIVIAVLMAELVAMLTISSFDADRWLPVISGLVIGAVLLYMGLRTGVIRFLLLSFITLVIGGGVFLAGITGSIGLGALYTLTGLCVMMSGACTLFNYLRSHPYEAEQSNEP
jgi:hypothetical protein